MTPRYIIGAGLVLGAFVAIAVVSYFSNRELYMSVDELLADSTFASVSAAAESSSRGDAMVQGDASERRTRLQVRGTVDYDTVERPEDGLELRFDLTGEGNGRLPVVYRGMVPDTFDRAEAVTVAGSIGPDGVFVADDLLVQCPSKYEAVPPGGDTSDL